MNYLDLIISLSSQSVLMILLIFVQAYFYKGRRYALNNNETLFITLPVSFLIFLMYSLNLSNILTIYIIVLTLSAMYVGLRHTLYIFVFILLSNLIYEFNLILVGYYLFIILFTYYSLFLFKTYQYRLIYVFLLSFLFLNGELYLNHQEAKFYIIYNLFCFGIWSIMVHLTLHYRKRNISLKDKQKDLFVDPKTKVNNYHYLLNKSYRLLKNKKSYISLILINVDRLKDINKLYGTICGDRAIDLILKSIKDSIKGYGQVYRLAGDTFCVIAINEKFKMMQTISERIRLTVEAKDIIVDNNKINISVSIGGYHGKIESKNIDDYLEVANESLLNSKYSGRNRVYLNNHMVYYPNLL